MRPCAISLAGHAAALLAACSPLPAHTEADLVAAETGAAALVREWAATGNEGRWADLPRLYADDATWIEQGELRYDGRAAFEAGVAQAASSGLTIQTTVDDIVATALAHDAAAVRARVAIVFGDPAAEGFAFDGMLSAVAVRIDGEWVFLEGHISAPQQRPDASARERRLERRAALADLTPEERAARREQFRQRRQQRLQQAPAPTP